MKNVENSLPRLTIGAFRRVKYVSRKALLLYLTLIIVSPIKHFAAIDERKLLAFVDIRKRKTLSHNVGFSVWPILSV